MNFFRSFRTLLLFSILVTNLLILPLLVKEVMSYVEEGFATQFVDNARSTTALISVHLSLLDPVNDQKKLAFYLDELIGLSSLNYIKLFPDNQYEITPNKLISSQVQFNEDIEFSEHEDNTYYLSGNYSNTSMKIAGLYQLGFDESVTRAQIDNAVNTILTYAVLFFVLSSIVVFYLTRVFTQPIAKLRDSANQIAAGNVNVKLESHSKISELKSLTDSLEFMRTQLVIRSNEISSHEIYEAEIMNNMADALIVIDDNWFVHDMNWEAQKLFKTLREEAVGKVFSDLFSEDLMHEMKDQIENKTQETLCFEWSGCKRRGICLYLELKLSIVTLNSGTFVVCSARDMTIRKKTEDALLNAKIKSDQASKAKSTFLYTMSHELRTPLNAIIGYSDLMLEDAISLNKPHFIDDLGSIQSSATHLLCLINTILDISKIEAGKMKVDVSVFSVKNLMNEILVTLMPSIELKGNTIEVDEKLLNLELESDFFKLKQILINLIDNASKFTSNGTIKLKLCKVNAQYVEISITDTGIGIAEDALSGLFDSFSQVDSSSTREYGGTGLGLAISRKLSHLLSGDIRVESEFGKGSKFIVQLQTQLVKPGRNVA